MDSVKRIKRGTIKTRLIVFPIIILFIVIAGIGVFSASSLKSNLIHQMKDSGTYLSERLIKNLNDNYKSLGTINDLIDGKIKSAGDVCISNKSILNNNYLKKMAENLGVEQLNWYNSKGVIIYSNIDSYIGWTAEAGHPVYNFMNSSENALIESIRQDTESKDYIKYGYFKDTAGNFVQVGINANKVQELTEYYDYENYLQEITKDKEIYYALFLDNDARIVAMNSKFDMGAKMGDVLEDEGSKKAAVEGVPFAYEWHNKSESVDILSISYPLVVNGVRNGAISIGYSLQNVKENINKSILFIAGVTVLAFIILMCILYKASKYVIVITHRLKEQVALMEDGDFSSDVAEDLINKNDELGEISSAISSMQSSMREIIKNVSEASESLATSSEELTATSQQSSAAANEVSKAIEDIAVGATEQARHTEEGVSSILELEARVNDNELQMKNLNTSAEKVNELKDQGIEIIKTLMEKTDSSKAAALEVNSVIIKTNDSAEKISTASEMIKKISDQTNLLALNAAIEAARAGEAGRGFAVVAEEIRKLAEQSNKFTEEIGNIVIDLTDKTSTAVKTMDEVGLIVESQGKSVILTNEKFMGIAGAIEEMKLAIDLVNNSSMEITKKKEDVASIMESLSAISEENAAGTEEASASVDEQTAAMEEIANSSEQLAIMAEKLNEQVRKFRI